MKVRISGQGNASLSGQGPNGDLIVTVQVYIAFTKSNAL